MGGGRVENAPTEVPASGPELHAVPSAFCDALGRPLTSRELRPVVVLRGCLPLDPIRLSAAPTH